MSKLRLDYFLSLGLKLVVGDEYINSTSQLCRVNELFIKDLNTHREEDTVTLYITSFSPRKNTGEQPCGNDVPVLLEFLNNETDEDTSQGGNWEGDRNSGFNIASWEPSIEALIKMQDEHDFMAQANENAKIIDEFVSSDNQETITDPVEISKLMDGEVILSEMRPDDAKWEFQQPTYTPEMKLINATPESGMKCRIEYKCTTRNHMVNEEVTYLSETDKEICLLDKDGLYLVVDKVEFKEWRPVDTRTELEIAQEKQFKAIQSDCMEGGFNNYEKFSLEELIKFLQVRNWTTEIVLPLGK